jgi:hypothetical protein
MDTGRVSISYSFYVYNTCSIYTFNYGPCFNAFICCSNSYR